MSPKNFISIISGPLIFFFLYINGPFGEMNFQAHAVLCSSLWIAIWWIFEAVPIPVTSLLPLVLFPLSGGLDINSTASAYGNKIIFFYIAGFIIAIAMQKWNLHKRIALNIIRIFGSDKTKVILGFMISTAFLSMMISNTSTAIMMLTIGIAVTSQISSKENKNFGKALMLAIAYSASIGGFATLYGTPPNMILKSNIEQFYNSTIEYNSWLIMAFPLSILLLLICWIYLSKFSFDLGENSDIGKKEIKSQLEKLGKISYEEKIISSIFLVFILALVFKNKIQNYIINIDDTVIAIFLSIFLFLIPNKKNNKKLIEWDDAIKLPWGIVLLFGAGLSIAFAIQSSGLAEWIGNQSIFLKNFSPFIILLLLVLSVNFLTEITSNLATVSMLLPILASIGSSIGIHPYILMISTTIAASCAFMLPVATPPNAIVFGSGYLKMNDMVRTGLFMNIISIILISVYIYFLLPLLWGIDILS